MVFEPLRARHAKIDDRIDQIGGVKGAGKAREAMLNIDLDAEQIAEAFDSLNETALGIDRNPAKKLVRCIEHERNGRVVHKIAAVVDEQHQQTQNHDLMQIEKQFPGRSSEGGYGCNDHQQGAWQRFQQDIGRPQKVRVLPTNLYSDP